MHRLIATCLVAVVGTAAAGTPLRASYVWPRPRAAHIVSLTAGNVTNALYRNHTSFIKDRVHEIGRGIRVSYAVRFH